MSEFEELETLLDEPSWWMPTGLSSDDRIALRDFARTESGLRCVVRLDQIRHDAGVSMGTWLPYYLDAVEEDNVILAQPPDEDSCHFYMLDLIETAASLY